MLYKNDIVVRCRKFAARIIRIVECLPKRVSVFSIGRQIIDSVGSVGANIVEARNSRTAKEFINSASIALREINETLFWIELMGESSLISESLCSDLKREAVEIAKIVYTIVRNYKKRNKLRS